MEEEKHLVDSPKGGKSTRCIVVMGIIIAVCVLLIFILVDVVVGLIIASLLSSSGSSTDTCTTPACVKLASTVLTNMDTSIDPCQDFYNYSCGGWDSRNLIPSGYGSWGVFQELAKQNTIFIEKLVSGNVDNSIDAVKLTRKLYDSCVDMDELDKLGATPLMELVNKTGGWNLVNIKNGT